MIITGFFGKANTLERLILFSAQEISQGKSYIFIYFHTFGKKLI
jgi:hypothetical protein